MLLIFLFVQSSACVGGLAKSQPIPDKELRAPKERNVGQSSNIWRRQWSSSPEAMENSVSISHSIETQLSSGPPTIVIEDKKFVEAPSAWNEQRKEWVGDRSKKAHRAPREPIISWCTTYDDLLSTNQPFPQPIPLSEMVDFLVDIWHDEGLYD